MNTTETNRAYLFFSLMLRPLALLHLLWLILYKYYLFDTDSLYRFPVLKFLDHDSAILHSVIFSGYTLASLLFVIRERNYIYSLFIALSLFYFEFSDKYSFHHDIFLAFNIYLLYFLSGVTRYTAFFGSRNHIIFLLKILCSAVYFFAGLHKILNSFDSGNLLQTMLGEGNLRYIISPIPLWLARIGSYFTLAIELLFPLFIWTRWKKNVMYIAMLLHLGITFFAMRGMLFNLYLPVLWILFDGHGAKNIDIGFKPHVVASKFLVKFNRFIVGQSHSRIVFSRETLILGASFIAMYAFNIFIVLRLFVKNF